MIKLNNKHKSFFILIITFIFISFYSFSYLFIYNKYKNIINDEINAYIEVIREEYPNVPEEKIIETLQNKNIYNQSSNLIEKYGYKGDVLYSKNIQNFSNHLFTLNIVAIVFIAIAISIFFLIYNHKRKKKIYEIIDYINNINNHIYNLKVKDNSEEDLSKLMNSIYKTTILLKETSDNSRKKSENLTKALSDISHQLKTPLTSIQILLDNIYENPDMDSSTRISFIKSISTQVEHISLLIVSLLNLAKFDSGTIKMNPKKFKVIDLINNVLDNLSIMIEVKNIQVIIDGDTDATLIADYTWQLEALLNIIKNCIEHSHENSKLYISIHDYNLFLKLIIKDQGEGISKKDMPHIFERFYKSQNSSKNSIGIGLPFAKIIIENNNGFITVDSKENVGTTFTIRYKK